VTEEADNGEFLSQVFLLIIPFLRFKNRHPVRGGFLNAKGGVVAIF